MPIQTAQTGLLTRATAPEPRINVLLADPDPISRHVLGAALHTAAADDPHLRFLACLDAVAPVDSWPRLDQAQVVVLSMGPPRDVSGTVRTLTHRGARVLVLAARWDRSSLRAAVSAGARGCLVKDTEVDRIAAAARAIASGYLLLSPELMDVYSPAPVAESPVAVEDPDLPLTERELDVLNLLAEGMTTVEAARRLGVSPTTIKSHVSHALPKLGARNRVEAVLKVRQHT